MSIRLFTKNQKGITQSAVLVGEIRATVAALTGASELVARPGFLYCNGAAVSRETYRKLFVRMGTKHGVGDGSTTFNLPDYRGRIVSCALDGQTAGGTRMAATAGTVAGEESHPLVASETPSHVHSPGSLSISGGSHAHSHNLSVSGNNNGGTTLGTIQCAWMSDAVTDTHSLSGSMASATHTHPSAEIGGSTGNGSADGLSGAGHSNVPPVLGCAFMVAF